MGFFTVKIRKTDTLFSWYIRTRDKWRCKRCKTKYPEGARSLHNSHFWGRKSEATRFEPLNCDALCFGCHSYFESNPGEYQEWKKEQLGEEQYKKLMVQAHTIQKRDDKLMFLYISKLLEEIRVDVIVLKKRLKIKCG